MSDRLIKGLRSDIPHLRRKEVSRPKDLVWLNQEYQRVKTANKKAAEHIRFILDRVKSSPKSRITQADLKMVLTILLEGTLDILEERSDE